jgi:hypothetical protein
LKNDVNLSKIQNILNPTFFAIVGALSIDSRFDEKIYNTISRLIPFIIDWKDEIFINGDFSVFKLNSSTVLDTSNHFNLVELFKPSNNGLR